ncbi:MAG: DMT family transporter [Candidatus Kuenenbacteria bacterium]
MNGIALAIYASFFLAIAQVVLKKSFREMEPSVSFFCNALFGLLIWIPIAFIFGAKISELPQIIIYAIVAAIFSEVLFFYALSKGQLSISAIIVATYPIYTIICSFFINQEKLSLIQILFVGITIFGTLISFLPSKLTKKELWEWGNLLANICCYNNRYF